MQNTIPGGCPKPSEQSLCRSPTAAPGAWGPRGWSLLAGYHARQFTLSLELQPQGAIEKLGDGPTSGHVPPHPARHAGLGADSLPSRRQRDMSLGMWGRVWRMPHCPQAEELTLPSRCSRSDHWESRGDVYSHAEEVFLSHSASGATRGSGSVSPGTPLQLLFLTSIRRRPGYMLDECLVCPQFILESIFANART